MNYGGNNVHYIDITNFFGSLKDGLDIRKDITQEGFKTKKARYLTYNLGEEVIKSKSEKLQMGINDEDYEHIEDVDPNEF